VYAPAEGFPLTVDDLLPILDVMSHANKHFKKVNNFMQYWRGEHGRFFPVKVGPSAWSLSRTCTSTVEFGDLAQSHIEPLNPKP
jgi:hypothetical protein